MYPVNSKENYIFYLMVKQNSFIRAYIIARKVEIIYFNKVVN